MSAGQDHGSRVAGMFGRIAGRYDLLNHLLSGGLDRLWRARLVRAVRAPEGGRALDLAAGTLDVSVALCRAVPGLSVAALDFAWPMLAEGARRKLTGGLERRIRPVQADGRALPLADASMDAATIAFGIRNILPRAEAFAELHRVLRPGARLGVLEFGTGRRRVWRGAYNLYLRHLLPRIGKLVSGDDAAYRYLADTIEAFPDERELAAEMRAAGFADVGYVPLCSGIVFLHVGVKAA